MLNKKITPENALETAVLNKDNAAIVDLIADGAFLTRPDILATKEAFDLYYPTAVLLLESTPCLREGSALRRLEELDAHPEMIDLVRDVVKPLPENSHPLNGELLEALKQDNVMFVFLLAIKCKVTLSSAPLEYFDCIARNTEYMWWEQFLDITLGERLKARLFLHICSAAKERQDPEINYILKIFKLIISTPASPERSEQILKIWGQHVDKVHLKDFIEYQQKISEEQSNSTNANQ